MGERLIPYGEHGWSYRTTYYREDGKERRYERTQLHVCTACMHRRELPPSTGQESLL